MVLDVTVGSDEEASSAGRRVLNHLARLRLDQANDAVNQWARREVLAGAGFLLGCVLFQQAFVKIAEALLACGKPIELVDGIGQRLEIRGLSQLGLRIGEDGKDDRVLGLSWDCRDRAADGDNIRADRAPRRGQASPSDTLWAGAPHVPVSASILRNSRKVSSVT